MAGLVVEVLLKGRLVHSRPFDQPALRIGRMRENDVVIDNLAVSRFHARLQQVDGRVFFEDHASENGSWVSGGRVHGRVELGPGDVVRIGKHELRVRSAREQAPAAAPGARHAPGRSDAWGAAQTYVAGPHTRAQLRDAGASPPREEREPMHSLCDESLPRAAEAAPAALHAGLIVQHHGKIDRVVPWEGDTLVLGRASDCDLVLPQEEVSRRHARLVRRGARHEIEDLGSINGTLVNGRRVDRHVLAVGDVVTIEGFQLTFVLDREPIAGLMKPAPVRPASGTDSRAMTILQEEMVPLDPEPLPAETAGAVGAEALPEIDLLCGPLDADLDERKERAERHPRTVSRASAVQELGHAPAQAPERVVLELHLELAELPEPVRDALRELGADGGLAVSGTLRLRADA